MIRLLDIPPLPEKDLSERASSDNTMVVLMVLVLLLALAAILYLIHRRKTKKSIS